MTTVHAYTNDQRLADVPHEDLRRSRAAAENIIPTTTWSPIAVERILPELAGKLDGIAMNVPVPDGSTIDLVTLMRRDGDRRRGQRGRLERGAQSTYKNIIEYATEPIVSSDVIGNTHSAIFDSLSTTGAGRQHAEDDHLVRQRLGLRDTGSSSSSRSSRRLN